MPRKDVARWLADGWFPGGRANQHTATLARNYPTRSEAMKAGRRLTVTWAIEESSDG